MLHVSSCEIYMLSKIVLHTNQCYNLAKNIAKAPGRKECDFFASSKERKEVLRRQHWCEFCKTLAFHIKSTTTGHIVTGSRHIVTGPCQIFQHQLHNFDL